MLNETLCVSCKASNSSEKHIEMQVNWWENFVQSCYLLWHSYLLAYITKRCDRVCIWCSAQQSINSNLENGIQNFMCCWSVSNFLLWICHRKVVKSSEWCPFWKTYLSSAFDAFMLRPDQLALWLIYEAFNPTKYAF